MTTRAGLALQPVAVALFASSPFANGAPSGYLSTRWHVYNAITPQVGADDVGYLPQYVVRACVCTYPDRPLRGPSERSASADARID